jgi:hypothetical protein
VKTKAGLPDISWYKTPKQEKIYQITNKIYQIYLSICQIDETAIKYTNIFHCKTLQNLPKLGFWQPWNEAGYSKKRESTFKRQTCSCKKYLGRNCSEGVGTQITQNFFTTFRIGKSNCGISTQPAAFLWIRKKSASYAYLHRFLWSVDGQLHHSYIEIYIFMVNCRIL